MTAEELASIARPLREMTVKVLDLENGFVECFGSGNHTTPTSPRDCKLYHNPDGTWRFHCQHTSCKELVDFASSKLTNFALGYGGAAKARRAAKQRQQTAAGDAGSRTASKVGGEGDLHGQAGELISEIVSAYPWPSDRITSDSDDAINEPVEQHYLQLLGLFADDDVVWVGRDVRDTGSPKHACRFRPVKEWLAQSDCPGAFTCPSTFRPGNYSRCATNVLAPKFLVVESDSLSRDEIGSIFRWLESAVGIPLRAVVDTGGKSLHGWFDYPRAGVLTQLKKWLPRFGCDPALFKPTQPCRLPGAKRGDLYQRLIFIR